MRYRRFPKIDDCQVSQLGFGLMRLPQTADGEIDCEAVRTLVKAACDNGVNYFDTAYPYHGGKSELVIGRILQEENLRDKVYLADKCPPWEIKVPEDFDRILDEQLQKLRTDHIDFYLMHALNRDSWQKMRELGCISFLERSKRQGKIRHIGFSFHDSLDVFKSIIDAYPGWEFCQIQFNYYDCDGEKMTSNPGRQALEYAAEREIGVIIMEPLRGGLLAVPPKGVSDILATATVQRSPADWGLRFVWDRQETVLALSGMNSMDQMMENIATASDAGPNELHSRHMGVISAARAWFESRVRVPCTGCRYCVPCPREVAIPEIFRQLNDSSMRGAFEDGGTTRSAAYLKLDEENHSASVCVSCGACVKKCPQHIDIPARLKEADGLLRG